MGKVLKEMAGTVPPLLKEAYAGNRVMVQGLLNSRNDPNCVGPVGITPLHCAAAEGHGRILRLLLEYGAEVSYLPLMIKREFANSFRNPTLVWIRDKNGKLVSSSPCVFVSGGPS